VLPVAIIQARMGSTRLPGKTMMDLAGKPVLWHVLNRVSQAKLIEKVVVATTVNAEDDVLAGFCAEHGIAYCRGSQDDVLDRFYRCAKAHGARDVVRITADCPLHDPAVIDMVIREYLKGGYDYMCNAMELTFPDGYDVEVFSFAALEAAWTNARLPSEREHVTPNIRKDGLFRVRNIAAVKKYPPYRCSLDQIEDYRFIEGIYHGIGKELFGIEEVMAYLEHHPELARLNQHIRINEGYQKSLKEDEQYLKGDRHEER
jgi:spore coat polysaccharide biosynthesis protein SpsF